MNTRLLAAALAVVVVLPSFAACGRKKAPDPTAWQNVTAMIGPDGTVGLDMALKAFSVTYGRLPGVELPKGKLGTYSGTPAATWILDHWAGLTGEQREKVTELLRLPGDIPANPAAFGRTGVAQPKEEEPIGCDGKGREKPLRQVPVTDQKWKDLVGDAIDEIEARLGMNVPHRLRPVLCQAMVDIPNAHDSTKKAGADALAWFHDDKSFDCRITFFPAGVSSGAPSKSMLIHELMHCFMARLAGRAPGQHISRTIPPWVNEGIANFAASDLSREAYAFHEPWRAYILNPFTALNRRTYDAIGFFWHLENTRHDMWDSIEPIVKAGDSPAAFAAAVAQDRDRVLNNLPSSWVRDARRGVLTDIGPWDMGGVGSTGDKYSAITGRVANGTQETVSTIAWASWLKTVNLQTEVLMFDVSAQASGRFGPGKDGNYTLAEAASKLFCVKQGGCVCPDGTKPPVEFTDIPGGDAHVAVTGGTAEASVTLSGQKLTDYCKDPKRPKGQPLPGTGSGGSGGTPKPGGGCIPPSAAGGRGGGAVLQALQTEGASCGVSNGDPHLITFDGVYYDMQAVGEFIMTKSTVDSLQVQARTAPIGGLKDVSVNSAVAADVAGDRVAAYIAETGVTVKVNGSATALSEGDTPLPKGGKLSRQGNLIGFVWPDGTQVWLSPIGSWGLKLEMSLAAARNGRVIGLLGNADRNAAGDLSTRDGRKLPDKPAFGDLYPAFADSWRVPQAESLFDYAPGTDTNTFTDRSLPQKPIDLNTVPNRAAAESTCRAAGVSEPALLEACILDVALTGHTEFATATAGLQEFLKPLTPSAVVNGIAPGGILRDGDIASGRITEPHGSQHFSVFIENGTRFWVVWTGPTTACDQHFSINVLGVSHSNFPCTGQAAAFELPAPGMYAIEIQSWRGGTGHYSFRVTTKPPSQ